MSYNTYIKQIKMIFRQNNILFYAKNIKYVGYVQCIDLCSQYYTTITYELWTFCKLFYNLLINEHIFLMHYDYNKSIVLNVISLFSNSSKIL